MKVVITGSGGFVGRNLVVELREWEGVELILIEQESSRAELDAALAQADVVFHLAGVNRPKDEAEFATGNADLTRYICERLAETERWPRIVLSSSIQAELDNPYGVSKRAAERAVEEYAARARLAGVTGAARIYRFPNIFGKWSRPNYNSAVATWCHLVARDKPIEVRDPLAKIRLVYIDDVVGELVGWCKECLSALVPECLSGGEGGEEGLSALVPECLSGVSSKIQGESGGSGSTPTECGRRGSRPSRGVDGNSALYDKREGMGRHSPEWQGDDADREIGVPSRVGSWRAQCAGQREGKKEGDNLNHLPNMHPSRQSPSMGYHFLNHESEGGESGELNTTKASMRPDRRSLLIQGEIRHSGIQAFSEAEELYGEVEPVYERTLGEVSEMIVNFKFSRETLEVGNMRDEFSKKLYSTYLSFLPEDEFAYDLVMHEDERGSFTEFLKTKERGQVSVNISKPGIVKGNHWHHTKVEKFLVVSGRGVIRFRSVIDEEGSRQAQCADQFEGKKERDNPNHLPNHFLNQKKAREDKEEVGFAQTLPNGVIEYYVSGERLQVVDIPPGYAHNIENLGETDMVTVMWANEVFDRERPDTKSSALVP